MAAATFDTLKFANTLKAAGVPDKQAEAQAAAFAEALQGNFKDLATKDDLAALGKDLRHEMKELELRLGNRIDAAVAGLTNKIDALIAGLTNKIDQGTAETKNVRTELKGDVVRLQWMLGAVLTGVVGVLIRLFLYPPR